MQKHYKRNDTIVFTICYESADEFLPVLCDSLRNIDLDMGNQHMNQVHAMGSAVGNKHRFATNVFALKS